MLFTDSYKTISGPSEGIFRDKGSKFIAYAYPIVADTGLKNIVSHLKTSHPKANHYCWALRLSTDRSVFRINDDGEPSGTAGRPILNTLLSHDLTNVLVVVVRYFGGTLLGVPGLINAYKQATTAALNAAELISVTIKSLYEISFDYSRMNDVMKLIKDENITITSQSFDNVCVLHAEIPQASQERILERIKKIREINVKYIRTL